MTTETWNLTFTAKVAQNNRVVIPSEVVEASKLKEGDIVSLTMTQIHRTSKEA